MTAKQGITAVVVAVGVGFAAPFAGRVLLDRILPEDTTDPRAWIAGYVFMLFSLIGLPVAWVGMTNPSTQRIEWKGRVALGVAAGAAIHVLRLAVVWLGLT